MTKQLVPVTTYQGMTAKVNPDNPNFNSFFKDRHPLKYIQIHAIISDGVKSWREAFKVSNMEVATEQIKESIQFFNETRLPYLPIEKERTFLSIYEEDIEVSRYEDEAGMSGWLDPEGVFHPCGFGEHIKYALDLLNKEGENKGWRSANTDEVEELMLNQHISMSTGDQSTGGFMSILGSLTPMQVNWFNRFFYKLSGSQKLTLIRTAQDQGIKLKYQW